jgi:4-hydroxyacetophenone monooxygenase
MTQPAAAGRGWLGEAVEQANLPTLLAVLVHLTGDWSWLNDRYSISRPTGLSDNDGGGLSEERQHEVRRAALSAIGRYIDGSPPAVGDPTPEQFVDLLQFTIGELIPVEYGPMIKDDFRSSGVALGEGDLERPPEAVGLVPDDMARPPADFVVGIIGAGISGISAAMSFEKAGIEYIIMEKHESVGGSWLENRYPGAGVDTPSHLYSWPGIAYDWRQYFALRDDVLEYLQATAKDKVANGRILFNTEVRAASFDASMGRWNVTTCGMDGDEVQRQFDVVISAVGLFNTPSIPVVPGHDRFRGPSFHTARWPAQLDLHGKRVAVIGNGASAMQAVPAIVDEVESLTIFQRTPQWVAPFEKFHASIPELVRQLIQEVPVYRWWYRVRQMWMFNDRFWRHLEIDPNWPHPGRAINAVNDKLRIVFTDYMSAEVNGREDLIEKIIPSYPPYTKRILFDNGWYKALTREHVKLVAGTVTEINENGLVSDTGEQHDVDIIVYATGFNAVRFLGTFELTGPDGINIRDVWGDDDAKAYLGTVIPGFPNLFCMYGPNLQAGHGGSFMTTAAAQVRYIMTLLDQMFRREIAVVDCRQEVCDEYNRRVDEANSTRIWTHPGTHNYYRNSRGRVVVNRAFKNLDYWTWTRSADLSEFEVLRSGSGGRPE